MKLDYDLLKQILESLEKEDSHLCNNYKLMGAVNSGFSHQEQDPIASKVDDKKQLDKFIGHLRILSDNHCIDCDSQSLGFREQSDSSWVMTSVSYRMTSRGYEFLDMLKNKTVFNRIKNFSITTAFDIGKALLIDLSVKGLST